jgi:hypothetical protein
MQITIDTHKFVKFLSEKKHFTLEQAETLVEVATEYHNAYTRELATKQDLLSTKGELKQEISDVRRDIEELKLSTKRDIEELKLSTKRDIEKLKLELVIRLGGVAIACTGILLAGIPIIMKSF